MKNEADSRLTHKVVICLAAMCVNYGLIMLPKNTPWYTIALASFVIGNILVAWRVQHKTEAFESSEHYVFLVRVVKYSMGIMIGLAAIVVATLATKGKLMDYSVIFFILGTSFVLVVSKVLDTSLNKKLDKDLFGPHRNV